MREPIIETDFDIEKIHIEKLNIEKLNLEERPGCLSGLLKLFALRSVYDWLQKNFGFGRGCLGTGCGIIFFVVAAIFLCSIIFGTNWFDFGF